MEHATATSPPSTIPNTSEAMSPEENVYALTVLLKWTAARLQLLADGPEEGERWPMDLILTEVRSIGYNIRNLLPEPAMKQRV